MKVLEDPSPLPRSRGELLHCLEYKLEVAVIVHHERALRNVVFTHCSSPEAVVLYTNTRTRQGKMTRPQEK